MEKDSPSSRTTKTSFFSESPNFGNVSPFLVGARNTFSELIYPLVKLPNWNNSLTFYNLSQALGSFGFLPQEQAQALLSYCHFHSFLILHYIYYISQRSNATNCFRITGLQRQHLKPSADNNTCYSPSKSITECIKFTKRAELWTDSWQLDDIFEPPGRNELIVWKPDGLFFSLASHALWAYEACALRARKTLTPRFTDFFTYFEKKATVL